MKPPVAILRSSPGGDIMCTASLDHRRALLPSMLPGGDERSVKVSELLSVFGPGQAQPLAPKPPKKRYLEENYLRINLPPHTPMGDKTEVKEEVVKINGESKDRSCLEVEERPTRLYSNVESRLPDVESRLPDVESRLPDVESRLPDVVPRGELLVRSQPRPLSNPHPPSWRKRLLSWDHNSNTDHQEVGTGTEVEREAPERRGKRRRSDTSSGSSTGSGSRRTGGARACKGQKYREFMWTNVIHQRRKSSRWELCQDAMDSSVILASSSPTTDHLQLTLDEDSKTDPLLTHSPILLTRGSNSVSERSSVERYFKKKKVGRRKLTERSGKKPTLAVALPVAGNQPPRNRTKELSRKRPTTAGVAAASATETGVRTRNHSPLTTDDPSLPSDRSRGNSSMVTGSKKRKLRRQSIQRLQPGSDFKDTRVVEDSAAGGLVASVRTRLRSGSDIKSDSPPQSGRL